MVEEIPSRTIYHINNKYFGFNKSLWEDYWQKLENTMNDSEIDKDNKATIIEKFQQEMEQTLWIIYKQNEKSKIARDELIKWYTSFSDILDTYTIPTIIRFLRENNLPFTEEDLLDFVQNTAQEFCDGVENYDPNNKTGAKPRTYLTYYIKSAVFKKGNKIDVVPKPLIDFPDSESNEVFDNISSKEGTPSTDQVEENEIQEMALKEISQALDKLSKNAKNVVELRLLGVKNEDIAKKLGLSHENVRKIYHDAKIKLSQNEQLTSFFNNMYK